ncbi:YqzL family protein [Sporolactobacillus sp. CPB3-1]|uniref:YqzL family protein n=1 Tax=Sporolactobacillus mangiferae TaxID=2940498 RepID=A0ABT0M6C9_9BACL|nr:YqzL family protein [Sporolactobacillus mangiferae]MCL1630408.1 YqzL family protein [Sporolactobacillus mangiferae]
MLELSWKLFSMTGSIGSYLLIKELERTGYAKPEHFGRKIAAAKKQAGAS